MSDFFAKLVRKIGRFKVVLFGNRAAYYIVGVASIQAPAGDC
jgi:hypothetical protein